MLYKQSVDGPKGFSTAPLTDLYAKKTNRRFLRIPFYHLVWMHHKGENRYNGKVKWFFPSFGARETFIRKKEKKENIMARKLAKASRPKNAANIQYRWQRKIDQLNSKIENGNNFMQWGENITVFDSVSTNLTVSKFEDYLFSEGYFLGKANYELSESNRKVTVQYSVEPGPAYHYDTIIYQVEDSLVNKILEINKSSELVHQGDPFKQDLLGQERERIESLLRDKGYYDFTRQHIDYELDTTSQSSKQIALKIHIQNPPGKSGHHQFRIDSIYFTTDVGLKETGKRHSDYYRGINFNYYKNRYHKKVLRQRVSIYRDSLYNRSATFNTQRQLANLDIFKFVNVNYDTSDGRFIANIFTSPVDINSWSNEAGFSVTQGFPGPYFSSSYKKRNVFGGLEIFDITGRFGYQGVTSATSLGKVYQSIEASLNTSLTFPQFLLPLSGDAALRLARFNPRSRVLVGFTYTDQPDYQRSIVTISNTYTWENQKKLQFSLTIPNLNTINSKVSRGFDSLLHELDTLGNTIINAFKPSFITSIIFSVVWNQHSYGMANTSSFFVRASVESGGGLLNIYSPKFIENAGLEPYQYVRLSLDARRIQVLDKNTSLAFRFNSGIGYAYSTNKVLPYEKNFFVGGSNSVRAWRPRRLGQGAFSPPESSDPEKDGLFDYRYERPGEALIEASLEFRQKLFGFVNYALFVDAGNVWTLRAGSSEEGQFKIKNAFSEIGVGTGFGLRFDFTFLILRLDVGMKVYDPARPGGERFVLDQFKFFKPFGTSREPVIYNIGIGYPF